MIVPVSGLQRVELCLLEEKTKLDRSTLQEVTVGILLPGHHVPHAVCGDHRTIGAAETLDHVSPGVQGLDLDFAIARIGVNDQRIAKEKK